MEFNIGMEGDVVIIDIKGDLVASTAEEFKSQVSKLGEKKFYFILADLSNVNFMDSSGLGSCMAIHKSLSEKNGALVLARPTEGVAKVFRITRADQKLKVVPTKQDGIKAVQDAVLEGRKK